MSATNVSVQRVQAFANAKVGDFSFNDVQTFLQRPDISLNYLALKSTLDGWNNSFASDISGKILLSLDDGTVVYDSSVVSDLSYGNTWTNFTKKFLGGFANDKSVYRINENHASRPEIQLATLSTSGVGWAVRFSTSTSFLNTYYAIRVGESVNSNLGTIRFAMNLH